MFNLFLIVALSLGIYQKNRFDNVGLCEGNTNKFCEAERKSLKDSIAKMEQFEKDFPSDK